MLFSEVCIRRTEGKGKSDPAGQQKDFPMRSWTALDQVVQICRKVGFVKCGEEKHCNEDGAKRKYVKSRQSCESICVLVFRIPRYLLILSHLRKSPKQIQAELVLFFLFLSCALSGSLLSKPCPCLIFAEGFSFLFYLHGQNHIQAPKGTPAGILGSFLALCSVP